MNIEFRRNVFCLFNEKMERSDSTLRNFAVHCFIQAAEAGSLSIKKSGHFAAGSYEFR